MPADNSLTAIHPATRLDDYDDDHDYDSDHDHEDSDAPESRSEIRFANQVHVRTPRVVIVAVCLAVVGLLGILPGWLVWQGGMHNPAFAAMDQLGVPSWAAQGTVDHTSGDRWCVQNCLHSERTTHSSHTPAETMAAYDTALRAAGWIETTAEPCPNLKGSTGSCWTLDQSILTVTASVAACAQVLPSNKADLPPSEAPPLVASIPAGCDQTVVTIMVTPRVELYKDA